MGLWLVEMLIGVYIYNAKKETESEPRIVSDPRGITDRLLKPQPPTVTSLPLDSSTLVYIALSETLIVLQVSIAFLSFCVS